MAQYQVTFSCGHTETVQLFGKIDDRYRKIEWYEEKGLCSKCYKKEQEDDRKAYQERALSLSVNLPTLTGSEKQTAWAMTIRQSWIDTARYRYESEGKADQFESDIKKFIERYNENKEKFDSMYWRNNPERLEHHLLLAHVETSAKFFIEHRDIYY